MNGDETDRVAAGTGGPQDGGPENARSENLVDLINGLVEPSEPLPIPLTPETWGWAAVAVIAAALVTWLVWRWVAHRRADAYRRAALSALAEATTVSELSEILRRAALAAWPREDVAGLIGAEWIGFLDRTARGGFPAPAGTELVSAPWRDEMGPASPALRDAARTWLETHRPELASRPSEPERRAPA
jgi:hypothetical protein